MGLYTYKNNIDAVSDLNVISSDGEIVLFWKSEPWTRKKLNIRVTDSKGDEVENKCVDCKNNIYKFTNGKHGLRYDFEIEILNDGKVQFHEERTSMFLKYAQLPNIPVIVINT